MKLIIYTEKNTARLQYIAEFIFNKVLLLEFEITSSEEQFLESNSFKISYSEKEIANSDLQIIPFGLLDEENITPQNIEVTEWKGMKCFFTTSNQEIPFDIFSAAFYLISRYEEYLPYEPDLFQRFPERNSLALQYDFLHLPLVDLWILELKNIIQSTRSDFSFPVQKMTFIPTYDIDIAYSYLGKGIARNIGGAFRDVLSGRLSSVNERIKVLQQKQHDPFDSYQFLDKLHKQHHLEPIYFFLVSKGGTFDKNILPLHRLMKTLIDNTKAKYKIGVHPSYQSNESDEELKREIEIVKSTRSRQHYIRFKLPQTFRKLIELGIREDYSMGYGSINGFRASTSYPHPWFDLERNVATELVLFPFCYMECNSFYEQRYSSNQAFEEMLQYAEIVKKVNGTLITIWHNFSLGTEPMWQGWKEVYEQFLNRIEDY